MRAWRESRGSGRLKTDDKITSQWTQIFFRRSQEEASPRSESLMSEESVEEGAETSDTATTPVSVRDEGENVVVGEIKRTDYGTEEINGIGPAARRSSQGLMENAKILTVREKKLVDGVGSDAVQYLRFQKYIIIYIFFTTIVSCFIILPLNFTGSQLGNATDFGHTTLANLDPNDEEDAIILWIHVILAFLMFPAAILLMRRFSIGLKMTDTNLKITRTIAIENIPERLCTIELLKQHMSEAYKDFKISDIQVVYNVTKLMDLNSQLENVTDSLKFCKDRRLQDLEMFPMSGARCCKCFCMPCVARVPCVEYFMGEKTRLEAKILEEKEIVKHNNLGMAFVTFENINHARHFLRDHKNSILHFKERCKHSNVPMNPKKWSVWYAPPPGDVIWENMSNRHWTLVKKILANRISCI